MRVARPGDEGRRGAEVPQRRDRREPERAGTEDRDHRACVRFGCECGMHRAGGRFHHHRLVVGDPFRNGVELRLVRDEPADDHPPPVSAQYPI